MSKLILGGVEGFGEFSSDPTRVEDICDGIGNVSLSVDAVSGSGGSRMTARENFKGLP